ncbi:tripartite tricarboxylate transporter permease [Natrialbaceae archaeon A-chndr2]
MIDGIAIVLQTGLTDALFEAAISVFTPRIFGFMILGCLLGIFFGALPGIGASLGMALVLPLTIALPPSVALIFLICIYSGAMYGGSIAAILINAPGTAPAAATTFDGYPMSRNGESLTALAISATGSAIGGFITITLLILLSPFLIEFILLFGSPEYFLIAFLGIVMITVVAKGAMLKGLFAGAMGLLLSTVGMAPMSIDHRYTFGSFELFDGINFVAVLIGLFAIAEMIKLSGQKGGISQATELSGSVIEGIRYVISKPILVIKSSLIGMGIGAIPGAGATVSNFIAYSEAVRSSSDPDSFGSGNKDGVLASESSNNGTIAGSIIPTIAFGIPGSAATAVFLGGLILHGLRPGPALFDEELATTYAFLIALLVSSFIILTVGLLVVTRASYITQIDTTYIIPTIFVLSYAGAYALRVSWVDIITVFVLGVIGYFMVKHNYSVIAFVLGVILGPIAEQNLYRSLQLSQGSWDIFINEPLPAILTLMIVVILIGPYLKPLAERVTNL